MFFVTSAPAGQNTFGCTASNVWTIESGISPTLVKSGGVFGGLEGGARLVSTGSGVLWSVSDTGQEIAVQVMLDTAQAQTGEVRGDGAQFFCVRRRAARRLTRIWLFLFHASYAGRRTRLAWCCIGGRM
jgi:hypothetical protein